MFEENYTCIGCGRNEIHKMCPAHGTPFYMSGIPYPEKLAKIVDVLSPEDRQVIFEAFKTTKDMWDSNISDKTAAGKLEGVVDDTDWYSDESWCPNCKTFTTQDIKWGGHERDSTHDKAICLTCKWEYNGYTGQYEPPFE